MFSSPGRLWIQEWILIREIVKAALWDDFQNGQRLIAKYANGQLATWNKFFNEQFVIVFCSIENGRLEFLHPSTI